MNLPAGGPAAAGQTTFIGTATTLIQMAGLSILTDPNLLYRGDRACVGLGVSTRRLAEPALSIQQLPDFRQAAEEAGLPANLHYLGRGDALRLRLAETS